MPLTRHYLSANISQKHYLFSVKVEKMSVQKKVILSDLKNLKSDYTAKLVFSKKYKLSIPYGGVFSDEGKNTHKTDSKRKKNRKHIKMPIHKKTPPEYYQVVNVLPKRILL